jgi:multicomponent Na+:H+ antiporter subunit B
VTSPILSATARALAPLVLVFSVFALLRGHNEPGGGFVGGLLAAAAFALWALAFGVGAARAKLRAEPRALVAAGLGVALASGLAGPAAGLPFLGALWPGFALPVLGKLGTPVIFDVGVYLAVLGVTLTVFFSLMED